MHSTSRWLVGSSSKRRSGFCKRALARAKRLRCPPLSFDTGLSMWFLSIGSKESMAFPAKTWMSQAPAVSMCSVAFSNLLCAAAVSALSCPASWLTFSSASVASSNSRKAFMTGASPAYSASPTVIS
mmetsp:Transcript_61280/g.150792  ORF Transcript_61280/g.150792 Transcript_61280/m.150792 type:complete len:127 (-) Transcript_61280:544-924(-)